MQWWEKVPALQNKEFNSSKIKEKNNPLYIPSYLFSVIKLM